MKRIMILALFFMVLISAAAYGDEYYEFVKITCAPEIGFLDIQSAGMANIDDFVWKEPYLNKRNVQTLERKYDLYLLWYGGTIKKTCTLKEKTIRIEIRRDPAKAQGQCSANPSSHISLWVDNKNIINSVTFGNDVCFPPYIKQVTWRENGGHPTVLLSISGNNSLAMEHTIAPWELRKINKPITDYYVESIFNKNMEKLENSIKEIIEKQKRR